MPDRRLVIAAFLASHGWTDSAPRPLAGDASFRRYWRLVDGRRRAVLMDAPPPHEDVRPFARLAEHLQDLGLSAPTILAADAEAGLLLLEDFGDETFTRLLANGAEEAGLYALAVDVLIALNRLPAAATVPAGLPVYDDRRLLDEACLFTDWYLPAVTGVPTPAAVRTAYVEAWLPVFPLVHKRPRTLVLRDFHVDNLMRLSNRPGVQACGLLDFQDAVAGPDVYDLMSLLEDARRDVPASIRTGMIDRYRAAVPIGQDADFVTAFAVLAAQRHSKVIGIFTRLSRRDGKNAYLAHIPRVWRLLETALRSAALAEVAAWFERHVPPPLRRVPAPAERVAS